MFNFSYRASYHGSYVARECFLPVNVGLGLRKDSSFKDVIDLRLEQLREAGIVRGTHTTRIPDSPIIVFVLFEPVAQADPRRPRPRRRTSAGNVRQVKSHVITHIFL